MKNLFSNKKTVRTEFLAGFTTFLTMAYILAVNPSILSQTGMDSGAVFVATAVSAAIATILFGLFVKLPFAMAPGMGLNAFFTFGVVISMGYTWQVALTSVFLASVIYFVFTLTPFRKVLLDVIPMNLKYAISAGIGLFITFIGLVNSGIIVKNDATLVGLGDLSQTTVLLAIFGLLIMSILLIKKVKGALIIGVFVTYVIGLIMGVASLPDQYFSLPPSVETTLFAFDFGAFTDLKLWSVVFAFFLITLFDTVGTLLGISSKAGFLNEKGELPREKEALMINSIGSMVGSSLGTSPLTAYVESSAGVASGGKTGLTSIFTGMFFLIALFVSPLFIAIPSFATSPILILMGLFMLSEIKKVDFEDYKIAIPAFITIVVMPFTYSIADGIIFGFITYVILHVFTGEYKKIHWFSYILFVLMLITLFVH